MDNKHKSVRMENTSPCRENRRVVCIFGFAHNRKFQVSEVTYGVEDTCSIPSTTVDLSAFAERSTLTRACMQMYFGYDLDEAPIAGKMWYPKDKKNCPVLFIVHGNHDYTTPSYLGYDYLGEYLASFGYAVVSVDENVCNDLLDENDARAVLLRFV